MVLAFKNRFVKPILRGTKKHTIREDSKDRWKRGNKIHAATGVRSKNYNCFYEGWCISTQKIEINNIFDDKDAVYIDGIQLNESEIKLLAINDGFLNVNEFWEWFKGVYFKGKIIHWTYLEYNKNLYYV